MTRYFIGLIIQGCLDDLLKLIYNLYLKWFQNDTRLAINYCNIQN